MPVPLLMNQFPISFCPTGMIPQKSQTPHVPISPKEIAEQVRTMSVALYEAGSRLALEQGIIIADTKFEFGILDDQVILIDECMTPDSSRFWPKDQYAIGGNPPSFDKQFVRDYLETSHWNKLPPAPVLPADIIAKTAQKYQEAFDRLVLSNKGT
jgi:phosphoribosylaminoimidazole-succinocarboxamide synthase